MKLCLLEKLLFVLNKPGITQSHQNKSVVIKQNKIKLLLELYLKLLI